jgi:Fe-S-cluster-containing hydrogenase component 2
MGSIKRIVTNKKVCRDCQACVLGCSIYHEKESNVQLARLKIIKDMARYEFDISICKHCKNPKCMKECPSDAMYLDERGVVIIIDEKCTRCGACQENCPFDAIYYNSQKNQYIKCDLCVGRENGPLCVELCPVGALRLKQKVEG